MKIGSTQQIKQLNKGLIRRLLKEKKIATKPELAKLSGLSVVTVNTLMSELVETGECFESLHGTSTGGRPALRYQYNQGYRLFLTICLAEFQHQETINLAICNLSGEILKEELYQFETVNQKLLDECLASFLEEYPVIDLICVGIPGIEIEGQFLIMDFAEMREDNLRQHLLDQYKVPVFIENDVNAAISGYALETVEGSEISACAVGLYYPSTNPPGMGVVIQGDVFRGKNGLVGEIQNSSTPNIWRELDLTKEQLEAHIIQSIVIIESLYDPDDLVLYGEYFDDSLLERAKARLYELFPFIELPKMVVVPNFYQHYVSGTNALALKYLEIQLDQE